MERPRRGRGVAATLSEGRFRRRPRRAGRPLPFAQARTRVVDHLNEIAFEKLGLDPEKDAFIGDTGGHRKVVDTGYFSMMRRAQIVVTCNPANWDGDFRLFEALSSGALVFTDELHTPAPYPLVDGVHLVVYDNDDKADLHRKLQWRADVPDRRTSRRRGVAATRPRRRARFEDAAPPRDPRARAGIIWNGPRRPRASPRTASRTCCGTTAPCPEWTTSSGPSRTSGRATPRTTTAGAPGRRCARSPSRRRACPFARRRTTSSTRTRFRRIPEGRC